MIFDENHEKLTLSQLMNQCTSFLYSLYFYQDKIFGPYSGQKDILDISPIKLELKNITFFHFCLAARLEN